jgi:WD40 repeat protein
VWDAATGEELHALTGSDKGGGCVRFSPDGRRVVSSGIAGTVLLGDMTTGQEALRLKGGIARCGSVPTAPGCSRRAGNRPRP